jgi:branched-chain amino acid aminotransferase
VAELQKPKFVYMGGRLRSWEEATLHVGFEGVTRGLNVFEGLKGYWQPDGRFGIVMLRHHYERLRRSARLLHIPCQWSYEEYTDAIFELINALVEPSRDMWARTTLYVTEGHWGKNTVADLVVTAYHQDKIAPPPTNLGVSTWRRSSDVALPARIKTGTNYQVARLARIEGRARGCQDMVLLNQWGRVAEATGSCVLVVRDGIVYTPPATEGALESITLDLLEALSGFLGIKFIRRPIDRTELLVADEIGLCGTLAELTIAQSIEGLALADKSPVLSALQNRYRSAVKGFEPHPAVELTILPCQDPSGGEKSADPVASPRTSMSET